MKRNNNKAFTLAELLIVVAVIAVLVAVAIPTFGSQLEKSRQAVDQSNLRSAYAAAKLAILNQDDSTSPLKTAVATKPDADTNYFFWFKEDSEQLTAVNGTDIAATSSLTTMGKATTGTPINADGLPKGITYNSTTLSDTDSTATADKVGTTTKGIVIKILYDVSDNVFTLKDVTFAQKASTSVAA